MADKVRDFSRVYVRLNSDTRQRLKYWADKKGLSENEYMTEALLAAIARENHDYDLPAFEIARLNQLTDLITALSKDIHNNNRVMTAGFESLIGLTRGDNYFLNRDEDGEL